MTYLANILLAIAHRFLVFALLLAWGLTEILLWMLDITLKGDKP